MPVRLDRHRVLRWCRARNTTSTSGQGCADADGTVSLSGANLLLSQHQRTRRYGVPHRAMLTYRDADGDSKTNG